MHGPNLVGREYNFTLLNLEFNGTTTIDGLVYHNIYRTYYDEQGNAKEPYLAAYIREEGKVVKAIPNDNDSYDINEMYWWNIPDVLYDFNNPMFLPTDSYYIEFAEINYPISEYSRADTYQEFEIEIGQTLRKGYQIIDYDAPDDPEYTFKVIEGIGVDCGFGDLLVPYRTYITGINSMSGLSAVYENGELVYKGCKYDEAQELKQLNAITTISGEKQAVSVRYYRREHQGDDLERRHAHERESGALTLNALAISPPLVSYYYKLEYCEY